MQDTVTVTMATAVEVVSLTELNNCGELYRGASGQSQSQKLVTETTGNASRTPGVVGLRHYLVRDH